MGRANLSAVKGGGRGTLDSTWRRFCSAGRFSGVPKIHSRSVWLLTQAPRLFMTRGSTNASSEIRPATPPEMRSVSCRASAIEEELAKTEPYHAWIDRVMVRVVGHGCAAAGGGERGQQREREERASQHEEPPRPPSVRR